MGLTTTLGPFVVLSIFAAAAVDPPPEVAVAGPSSDRSIRRRRPWRPRRSPRPRHRTAPAATSGGGERGTRGDAQRGGAPGRHTGDGDAGNRDAGDGDPAGRSAGRRSGDDQRAEPGAIRAHPARAHAARSQRRGARRGAARRRVVSDHRGSARDAGLPTLRLRPGGVSRRPDCNRARASHPPHTPLATAVTPLRDRRQTARPGSARGLL